MRPDAPPIDPKLLADNDYCNHEKHRQRLNFLSCCRWPVLNIFLLDLKWYKVVLDIEDLKSLRVIRDRGWSLLSGDSGNIDLAVENYVRFDGDPTKNPTITDGELKKEFAGLMSSIKEYREKAGNPNHNLNLILVGPSKNGPFTIIEGNHSAMGLFLRYVVDHPKEPFPTISCYIGVSPLIRRCGWAY